MQNGNYVINSPDGMWHAEVSACRGANIEKLEYRGNNVFIPLEKEEQWKEHPFVQGSPLLLPANRTVGGKFAFQGKEYRLRINDEKNNLNLHGLLYHQEFTVVKTEKNSIVLRYENTDEIYPFNFIITAEYTLESGGLKQKFVIKNTGKTDMPYTFALHTTFVEPEYFRVPISLAQEKNASHIPTGRYVPLNRVESGCASGIDPRGIPISGYYKANGKIVVIGNYRYTVSDAFDHFVLYNAGGNSGYLCVEPQAGSVNGLNIKHGCRIISVGGEDILCTDIEYCERNTL